MRDFLGAAHETKKSYAKARQTFVTDGEGHLDDRGIARPRGVWDYIGHDNPRAVVRMDELFNDAAARLAEYPSRGTTTIPSFWGHKAGEP